MCLLVYCCRIEIAAVINLIHGEVLILKMEEPEKHEKDAYSNAVNLQSIDVVVIKSNKHYHGIKAQFQSTRFFFHYHNYYDFFTPSWYCVHVAALSVIRGIFALYCIIFMALSIAWDVKSLRWLTYATSWNYILVTLYFITAFCVSLVCISKRVEESIPMVNLERNVTTASSVNGDENGNTIAIKFKIFWCIFSCTLTICSVVTVVYWALLHDYNTSMKFDLDSYLTVDRHGINLLLLFIDFFLHKIPFHLLHLIYPTIVGILYVIFNVSYWGISKNIVYSVMDWGENPGKASGISIGLIIAVPIFHFLWYLIHLLKRYIVHKNEEIV